MQHSAPSEGLELVNQEITAADTALAVFGPSVPKPLIVRKSKSSLLKTLLHEHLLGFRRETLPLPNL